MSNPWAEVYKDLRSEILDESDLQERRKLRGDIKTAATQTRYDLKSRVAKMRAQGKTDLEIKQYLDKYIANSKLPGEQKAQIRQVALSSGYELEGDQIDEMGPLAGLAVKGALAAGTALAGKAVYDKAKGVAGKLQQRNQQTQKAIDSLRNSYDPEGQQIVEESEKVLVRITTEDGRVFEKKVPREKISDLRKRYKTVVEVGSSEKAPTQTSNKPGGVSEGKHVKRWWDDDGDGKGYEDGEVSGKFKKKKKKIKSESFSDWRYEIQIDENQIGLTPKEMRFSENGGEKKNEGESESELSEHNDTNTCEESDRELANRLAEELGAEVLDVEVLDEFAGAASALKAPAGFILKVLTDPKTGQIIRAFVPIKVPVIKPPVIKPTPAPGPKPTPAPGPKPTPAPGPKPEPKPGTTPQAPTVKPPGKPGTATGTGTRTGTGTDTGTGTQTTPQTTPQTQTQTPIPTPTPPRGGGPVPPVRGPKLLPPIKIPFALPSIGEPKNVGKVVKV